MASAERGNLVLVALSPGEWAVPLNEIPKYFNPETRSLIDAALEQAWQELTKDAPVDVASAQKALARRKLAGTIVALVSIGETDPAKLKRFALNAAKAMYGGD